MKGSMKIFRGKDKDKDKEKEKDKDKDRYDNAGGGTPKDSQPRGRAGTTMITTPINGGNTDVCLLSSSLYLHLLFSLNYSRPPRNPRLSARP